MTYKLGTHPNSLANLRPGNGRPIMHGEKKGRHGVTVTKTAWENLQARVKSAGFASISELLEILGSEDSASVAIPILESSRYSKEKDSLYPKQLGLRVHQSYYLKLEGLARDRNCAPTEVGREIVEAGLDLLEAIAAKSDRPLAEISAEDLYELIA